MITTKELVALFALFCGTHVVGLGPAVAGTSGSPTDTISQSNLAFLSASAEHSDARLNCVLLQYERLFFDPKRLGRPNVDECVWATNGRMVRYDVDMRQHINSVTRLVWDEDAGCRWTGYESGKALVPYEIDDSAGFEVAADAHQCETAFCLMPDGQPLADLL